MPLLTLAPPDWASLVGGSQEAAWIADRNRKVGIAASLAKQVVELTRTLEKSGNLFVCTPDVLRTHRLAALWYVSLAGFSMKTLGNIRHAPAGFGLNRQAKTLVERLLAGGDIASAQQLEAFSAWINSEIAGLFPPAARDPEVAVATTWMILGGRVIGQGQNVGGDDAVGLLKSLLVQAVEARGSSVEVEIDGGWQAYRAEHNLLERQRIRFRGVIVCEFVSGRDRPDIVIYRGPVTVAVGEVKGRKDLANKWESWMPGVYAHLRTWTGQNPDAARLFFGTLVDTRMVEGSSGHGTIHVGLKKLVEQGLLTAAYNIAKVADNNGGAVRAFHAFVDSLLRIA